MWFTLYLGDVMSVIEGTKDDDSIIISIKKKSLVYDYSVNLDSFYLSVHRVKGFAFYSNRLENRVIPLRDIVDLSYTNCIVFSLLNISVLLFSLGLIILFLFYSIGVNFRTVYVVFFSCLVFLLYLGVSYISKTSKFEVLKIKTRYGKKYYLIFPSTLNSSIRQEIVGHLESSILEFNPPN